MKDIAEAYDIAMRGYRSAYEEHRSAFNQAQINGDTTGMATASMQMRTTERDANDYDRWARQQAGQMQRQQAPQVAGASDMSRKDAYLAQRFGLDANEVAIAKNWTSDARLSEEEKVKQYAENRRLYRQARADGSYRDDQGRVTR